MLLSLCLAVLVCSPAVVALRIAVEGDQGLLNTSASGHTGPLVDAIGTDVLLNARGKVQENDTFYSSPEGGYQRVYLSTVVSDGQSDNDAQLPICISSADTLCVSGRTRHSAVGFVYRNFTLTDRTVDLVGSSAEVQHAGICTSPTCVDIAAARPVHVVSESGIDGEDTKNNVNVSVSNSTRNSSSCLYLRRKVRAGGFVLYALPQAMLDFEKVADEEFLRSVTSNDIIPEDFMPWSFTVEQKGTRWNAYGYRGFVTSISRVEYEALPAIDVAKTPVDTARPTADMVWELVRDENEDGLFASGCAKHMTWALHAGANDGSRLDGVGLGLDSGARTEIFPSKVGFVEKSLAVAAGFLGLVTLYMMVVDSIFRIQSEKGHNGRLMPLFRLFNRAALLATLLIGLTILGLEITPLGISWAEELEAKHHRGGFVGVGLVFTAPREIIMPASSTSIGTVIVATTINGSASYISTDESRLRVALVLFIVGGVFVVLLAPVAVTLWRNINKPMRFPSVVVSASADV